MNIAHIKQILPHKMPFYSLHLVEKKIYWLWKTSSIKCFNGKCLLGHTPEITNNWMLWNEVASIHEKKNAFKVYKTGYVTRQFIMANKRYDAIEIFTVIFVGWMAKGVTNFKSRLLPTCSYHFICTISYNSKVHKKNEWYKIILKQNHNNLWYLQPNLLFIIAISFKYREIKSREDWFNT